jgi:hypothetical protein
MRLRSLRKPQRLGRSEKNLWRDAKIVCDLCGQSKECLQKEIDGKEYDICAECWNPLAEHLKGKGRERKSQEIVLVPPTKVIREREVE